MEKIEKIVVDENFTRKLLTRLDPLCLKDPHGHPIAFNAAYECYLLMMTKAKMFFPNGYIETSLTMILRLDMLLKYSMRTIIN